MRILMARLSAFIQDDDGLTVVEYAVAAGLITLTVGAAMMALGVSINTVITTINGFLTA